jgi:hypothetical protein
LRVIKEYCFMSCGLTKIVILQVWFHSGITVSKSV